MRFSPLAVWFATTYSEYHEDNHEGAAMRVRHMRLTAGLFFLGAGVTLLAFRLFAPQVVAKVFDPTRMLLGAILALVFAGLNLAKWYAGYLAYEQMSTPVRRPLQPDPAARGDDEPNPAFDFSKPADPTDERANG